MCFMSQVIYTLLEAAASMAGFSVAIFGAANIFGEKPIAQMIAILSLVMTFLFGTSMVFSALYLSNEFEIFSFAEDTLKTFGKFSVFFFLSGTFFSICFGFYVLLKFVLRGSKAN